MAGERESVEELLRRIDERTQMMLDTFNRHIEQDRADFKELHALVDEIPERALEAAREATAQALLQVGFDPSRAVSHQKDMALLREIRDMADDHRFFEPLRAAGQWAETQDAVKKAGLRAAVSALALIMLGLLWSGIAEKVRALFH